MSASSDITSWLIHTVGVERYAGRGVTGPVYDPIEYLSALVIDRRTQVRSASGETVISPTGVYLADGTDAIPLESRVTLPAEMGGRVSVVLSVSVLRTGLGTPDHVELRLS